MICGRTLFFGTVIAVCLLSGIARSSDETAPEAASTTEGIADRPAPRPAFEISDDASAIWRRSHNKTAANLRFIKPSIPGRAHAAAPAHVLATDGEASSQLVQGYAQRDFAPAQNASVKRINVKAHAAVENRPAQMPAIVSDTGIEKPRSPVIDQQLAGATAAKLQQLIEQPKPQLPPAIQSPNQSADGDSAIAVRATNAPTPSQGPAGMFITDEPNGSVGQQAVRDTGTAPRQLWAAGTRLLQEIGNLFPMTSGQSTAAQ